MTLLHACPTNLGQVGQLLVHLRDALTVGLGRRLADAGLLVLERVGIGSLLCGGAAVLHCEGCAGALALLHSLITCSETHDARRMHLHGHSPGLHGPWTTPPCTPSHPAHLATLHTLPPASSLPAAPSTATSSVVVEDFFFFFLMPVGFRPPFSFKAPPVNVDMGGSLVPPGPGLRNDKVVAEEGYDYQHSEDILWIACG